MTIFTHIKNTYIKFCDKFFSFSKVQENKILFINFNGLGYGDNPKAVCEYLRKNNPNLDLVWLSNTLEGYPEGVRVVKYGSFRSFYEQATSKVWLYNTRAFARINKKEGQKFIQLWHGPAGFKHVESAANMSEDYVKQAKYDSSVTDIMISDSALQTQEFKKFFWYNGPIEELGMPRNDVLYSLRDNQHYKDKIRKSLSINLEDKVVLYAPTFRDDGNLDYLNLDFEKLVCSLETGFGESVTLLIRLHPNAIHNSEKINFSKKIKNASFYSDMQELLIVSDVLISDYSSAITDFILLEKPYIRYANDLKEYLEKRGLTQLYFDLPDKLIESKDELYEYVSSILDNFSKSEIKKLRNEKIRPVFHGDSSQKVGEIVQAYVADK